MIKLKSIIKIAFVNIFFIYVVLYSFEIYFQIKNNNLFEITPYHRFAKISKNQEFMPAIKPTHLKDNYLNEIVPVSVVSNKKTLLCMDGDEPMHFKSDIHGFDNEILKKKVDLILIGDSYAAGHCVSQKNRFYHQFKKKDLDIINFGMGGNGPLLMFASMVEFAKISDYETIVWFVTPDNDYDDFEREVQNPILKKYLNANFTQNLLTKKDEKDKLYFDYFKGLNRSPFKEFLYQYHLNLKLLRKKIKIAVKSKSPKHIKSHNSYFNILSRIRNNPNTVNSINHILKNLKNYADDNNKNLLIVYNLLHPEILFNKSKSGLKKDLEENRNFLKKEGISFFDFSDYILKNYDQSNIDKIMKNTGKNNWDHYTNEGYRLLTEQIAIKVKNMQNK